MLPPLDRAESWERLAPQRRRPALGDKAAPPSEARPLAAARQPVDRPPGAEARCPQEASAVPPGVAGPAAAPRVDDPAPALRAEEAVSAEALAPAAAGPRPEA